MTHPLVRYAIALLVGCASYGCASAPPPDSITRDANNPQRIRFVVNGDPGLARYPEINKLPVPVYEQIREGMRRFAADELRDRHWCPNGFSGPDFVLVYESERLTKRFYVDCL